MKRYILFLGLLLAANNLSFANAVVNDKKDVIVNAIASLPKEDQDRINRLILRYYLLQMKYSMFDNELMLSGMQHDSNEWIIFNDFHDEITKLTPDESKKRSKEL